MTKAFLILMVKKRIPTNKIKNDGSSVLFLLDDFIISQKYFTFALLMGEVYPVYRRLLSNNIFFTTLIIIKNYERKKSLLIR